MVLRVVDRSPVSLYAVLVAGALAGAGNVRAETIVKGTEIEAAFVGKTFRVQTRQVPIGDRDHPSGMRTRTDGGYAEIDMFVRSDRSIIFRCTAFARDGSSAPCRGGGYARDVGVWTVEGEHFCYQFLTSRGGRKQCFAVVRDGTAFRLRLASGPPSTINGERFVQQ